jgi:hypothetical protein
MWRRQVSQMGQSSLSNRNDRVGRGHAGQEVSGRFDVAERQWVVQDAQGQELTRPAAEQITQERMMNLNVRHQRINKKSGSPA